MDKIRTRTSIFSTGRPGIIYKTVIEGVNVTADDVNEDQRVLLKITGGKKALVLINAAAFHTMTPEAIDKLKEYISKSRYATALVSKNLGVRIFVKTLSASPKNQSPIEMFPTEVQAVKWLLAQKRLLQRKAKHNTSVGPAVHKKPVKNNYEVFIDRNGILVKTIPDGAHVNVQSMKKTEKLAHDLVGDKKILTLIDRRANYTITPAAVKYIRQTISAKYRIATALVEPKQWNVIPQPKTKSKLGPPVKVFNDKASAVKWLLSLKKKEK